MNRRYSFLLVLLLIFVTVPTGRIYAEFTKAGAGLILKTPNTYEDERGGFFGIHVRGIYELSLPIHISPGFTYVIPNSYKNVTPTSTYKWHNSLFMFDADAHYVFNKLDRMELYGLAGLDLSIFRYHWVSEFNNFKESGGHTGVYPGLNIGAGAYIRFNDQIDFFVEGKVILSTKVQFIAAGGILVNLQWFAQHDKE
jgi:hypothetical protein